MLSPSRIRPSREAGFSLLEALISLALMGVIVGALGMVSAQWLPNWRSSHLRLQRVELLNLGLERIIGDLVAAEFVTPNRADNRPVFDGAESSVTLVRAAMGLSAPNHLEVVRLAEATDERGTALVRTRANFTPLAPGIPLGDQLAFADSVALVRAPYKISFAYAGVDTVWRDTWRDSDKLPLAVRISVRDASSGQLLALSTAALVHVSDTADCVGAKATQGCGATDAPPDDPSAAATKQ